MAPDPTTASPCESLSPNPSPREVSPNFPPRSSLGHWLALGWPLTAGAHRMPVHRLRCALVICLFVLILSLHQRCLKLLLARGPP